VGDGLGALPPSGEAVARLPIEPDLPLTSVNDGKVDPRGRLWFGTLDRPRSAFHCGLYRLDSPGHASLQVPGVMLGNGIGWSPAGDRMYFVDSRTQRVDRFAYDLDTGTLGERRVLAEGPAAAGLPDGLAVDTEGTVWVALFGGGQLHRYAPDGRLVERVPVPVRFPTCPTFAGPDLRTLVVTTAYDPVDDAGALDGALLVAPVEVPGLPAVPSAVGFGTSERR
jgi:sugar lactone lactonase YvrE